VAWARDTYTWAAYGDLLKGYLQIDLGDASEDARLELWLSAANEDCDHYTENEFVDAEGADIVHPSSILLGIYEWVMAYRSWYDPDRQAGATEVSTGPLREKYRGGNEGTEGAVLGHAAAKPHWYRSKVNLGSEEAA
jgi:hypothetical protein